jgi:thermostable 8-oxoguanine DNA glycosylase
MSPAKNIERIIYDLKLANERIQNRTRDFYNITNVSDLILDEKDFSSAYEIHEKETHIIFNGSSEISQEGLFRGIVYCLLTPMQIYEGQIKGFESIFDNNLNLITKNVENIEKLASVLKKSGIIFHEQKAKYIQNAKQVLDNTDLLSVIKANVKTTRDNEVKTRLIMSNSVLGFGLKTSSILLRMCSAENVIPIDSTMMEMLYFHGYPCDIPRSNVERIRWETKNRISRKLRKRELSNSQYLEAESFTFDLAQKYEVPGYILQLAVWTKKSTYKT